MERNFVIKKASIIFLSFCFACDTPFEDASQKGWTDFEIKNLSDSTEFILKAPRRSDGSIANVGRLQIEVLNNAPFIKRGVLGISINTIAKNSQVVIKTDFCQNVVSGATETGGFVTDYYESDDARVVFYAKNGTIESQKLRYQFF